MPLNVEDILDGGIRRQKSLRGRSRFEAEHFSFAPSDRQMRVFGAIVLTEFALPLTIFESDFAQSSSVGFESIDDDALGLDTLVSQQSLR